MSRDASGRENEPDGSGRCSPEKVVAAREWALGAGITFALVARKKHVARRRKHTRTNKE